MGGVGWGWDWNRLMNDEMKYRMSSKEVIII